jgi:hypothetical protein
VCTERDLHLNPSSVHVDFEPAMHNFIVALFPDTRIDCCSLHLGQAWWCNIQRIGLSSEYKDKSGEIGKWLSKFFGLPFLLPEVADDFVEDIMADTPDNEKCMEFADYVLNNYIEETARVPLQLWDCVPSMFGKRTNNGPDSFHAHFNTQFNPPLYIFVDVLLKQQSVNYTKIRGMDIPAGIRCKMREKLEYSIDQNQMYNNGEITRLQHLKRMGYKHSTRTDL